jgi:two-component system, chemotaxis family, protein-glutamate methylesterase/glutaminase
VDAEGEFPMTEREQRLDVPGFVVAIGLSADGLGAIGTVLEGLPAGFEAPVLVCMHRAPVAVSGLTRVMARRSALPVREVASMDVLVPGHVYVAPPDAHLVVVDGRLQLKRTERVSFARPSIDVLFDSVAKVYGPRTVGVILSGGGRDGARGLQAIKAVGGTTIVQDPKEARFGILPRAAIAADGIDFTVPLDEVAPTILAVVSRRHDAPVLEASTRAKTSLSDKREPEGPVDA